MIGLNDDNLLLLMQNRLQSAEVANDVPLPGEPKSMDLIKH